MKNYFKRSSKIFNLLFFLSFSLVIIVLMIKCKRPERESSTMLKQEFLNPPQSAKPRIWWHWKDGNVTKEGIKADLEWMKRVGIGGFQNFNAMKRTRKADIQIVENRLVYMTPEWKKAFLFATKLADSLGLEMAIASSPGWSHSGGPWVSPEQAMKKFVWSTTKIKGGIPFNNKLPLPPSETGPFQNISSTNKIHDIRFSGTHYYKYKNDLPRYYADAAVIAYKAPKKEMSFTDLNPKITSSSGNFNIPQLTDGDLQKSIILTAAKNSDKAWILFEFDKPEIIQSFSITSTGSKEYSLEASDDSKTFYKIVNVPFNRIGQQTITFAPKKAKYFRVTFNDRVQIGELVLHPVPRVHRFEEKAAFSTATDLYDAFTPSVRDNEVINKDDVIDLTSIMQPDGSLNWTPPEGNWVIIRLGYSLTGNQNGPASPEATGLEIDKLSAQHVKAYFNYYLNEYKDATNELMGKKGLQYLIADSFEFGVQNWTNNMINEFKRLRGYDILSWLPVLTGRIVDSAEASDRFLWDFRKTIADLIVENFFNQLTTILEEREMGSYIESHEYGRAFFADGMEIKRQATIPMSATWIPKKGNEVAAHYKADVRESASVAHLYGKKFVATESLTTNLTPWAWSPETLKPTTDMELANGVNRFVIHTSVHQPLDDKIPGLGLGPFGQWFTRHETWAEEAIAWTTYLARSCYMLQQGKFVADIIYFYGEDNNITSLFGEELPDIPEGYNYDFVNHDALVNLLSVNNGQITTPSGMNYRILVLDDNCKYMSLQALKKIRKIVKNGAVVIGKKPIGSPTLIDNHDEFNSIVNDLWPKEKGKNSVGKGKVYAGYTISEVLAFLDITPDFQYSKPKNDTKLLFVHRKLDDIDIYWVNNRNDRIEELEVTFRVKGKKPELWQPVNGNIKDLSYSIVNGLTKVPIHMEPNDAVFIVFRGKAIKPAVKIPQPIEIQLAVIEGPWKISFQPGRGAPKQIVLDKLISWSENNEPEVKYFSGKGTYTKTIHVPQNWLKDSLQIWLDLGSVKNIAEIIINGKSLGIVWKKPFRVNITEAIKQGVNQLEVKVTNLWVNRLIGDQQPETKNKITYTTIDFYEADSSLLPSGLLGPVKIISLSQN